MRGKVAKAIRRRVYGDMSIRERKYRQQGIYRRGKLIGMTGTRRCDGLRAVYQYQKKAYMQERRDGASN